MTLNPEGAPIDGWIKCSFEVQGRPVTASVRRFDQDERQRVSAEIAWFLESLAAGLELATIGWPDFLERVVSPNVAVTVDEHGLEPAPHFWNQLFCRTFEALMLANDLPPGLTPASPHFDPVHVQ
jgi:hypothetical protein